jgi:hypothetical protein
MHGEEMVGVVRVAEIFPARWKACGFCFCLEGKKKAVRNLMLVLRVSGCLSQCMCVAEWLTMCCGHEVAVAVVACDARSSKGTNLREG